MLAKQHTGCPDPTAGLPGSSLGFRDHRRAYLVIGLLNSALPFSLFAFASIYLSASYSLILNASAPLWGAMFSAVWLDERLTFLPP